MFPANVRLKFSPPKTHVTIPYIDVQFTEYTFPNLSGLIAQRENAGYQIESCVRRYQCFGVLPQI